MDTTSLAELEQHVGMLRERVLQVAADVKTLLAEDLPKFVEREVKRIFVGHPEFARTISDKDLASLKTALHTEGESAARAVLAKLEDDSLWFPGDLGAGAARKSISENTALWNEVGAIAETVKGIMARHKFPDSDEPIEYKPPTWFIGRRYLPSLSEKYWRHLQDLSEVQDKIDTIVAETSKNELTKRWDSAE